MKTDAREYLKIANATILERGVAYDGSERSMAKVVEAFNTITDNQLCEEEGWLFMVILKNVRLFNSQEFSEDSAIDGIAYSALMAECFNK